ncbi:MAG: MBL fold metallo-hydrolase [Pseudomonadota bacterium]
MSAGAAGERAGPLLRATILGCGSSGGVPRLGGADAGGNWGACDPSEPKNRRLRCALLVERVGPEGVTSVLVDAGPDLREQLLAARVARLDAVLLTHDHADHVHGVDDLRQIVFLTRERVPVHMDAPTWAVMAARFGYAFETPDGSLYPPILKRREISEAQIEGAAAPIVIDGPGGAIAARPFPVEHGPSTRALGFRFESARAGGAPPAALAYLPDVSALTQPARAALGGLDLWILDALRYTPHPTHANLETALAWISEHRPKRAILTNMHYDLDYATVAAETPADVEPAFDGMRAELA